MALVSMHSTRWRRTSSRLAQLCSWSARAAAGLVGTVEMTPRAQAKGSCTAKERGGVQGHHCRPGSRFLG
jgi:hypothetical protein